MLATEEAAAWAAIDRFLDTLAQEKAMETKTKALEALRTIDVRAEVDNYEHREPDYTPNDAERALLEDFGNGLIGAIHETIEVALSADAGGVEVCWQGWSAVWRGLVVGYVKSHGVGGWTWSALGAFSLPGKSGTALSEAEARAAVEASFRFALSRLTGGELPSREAVAALNEVAEWIAGLPIPTAGATRELTKLRRAITLVSSPRAGEGQAETPRPLARDLPMPAYEFQDAAPQKSVSFVTPSKESGDA